MSPPQAGSRTVDPVIFRKRNLVERFFNKVKRFRRIATRSYPRIS
jgi:transposase